MTHRVMRHVALGSKKRWGARRSVTATVAAAALVGAFAVALPTVVSQSASAAPAASATDPTTVPHYFGPWTNWALSPLAASDAAVQITGDGTGAAASATIDPVSGGVASIDIVDPGKGYTTATVTITGGDGTAQATATVDASGTVTSYAVTAGGAGYSAFDVAVNGGATGGITPTTGATAQGSGGVDSLTIVSGGAGYTQPTVEFDLPDLPNGVQATGHVVLDPASADFGLSSTGAVTKIILDNPGSGYLSAPAAAVHNGTVADPISGVTKVAKITTTLTLLAIDPVDFGSGYTDPTTLAVDVTDPGGAGAGATADGTVTTTGSITAIAVTNPGAGFLSGGIKKFQDELPLPCDPSAAACPVTPPCDAASTGACPQAPTKYIPVAALVEKTYSGEKADEYVIGLVQYRTKFHTDLPPTLARGYVQVESADLDATGETPATKPTAFRADGQPISQHYALVNEMLDGTRVPVRDRNGNQVYGVTSPQWLGPFVNATKDKPVRVVFHNYLPTGSGGNLFLPVDSTMMGSGMAPMDMGAPADGQNVTDEIRNPACTQEGKSSVSDPANGSHCFADDRALLHLHGGMTPWISDGTPHQWITPAGENTTWPKGVGVTNVPDMADPANPGTPMCAAADSGCETYYYTNQQSARLLWYHDHSWGITRLNVYVGEAAGYTITDDTEKALVATGTIPGPSDTIPLVVQDRTFVPSNQQLYDMAADGTVLRTEADHVAKQTATYGQDPTWDAARWGTMGSFWYHHVYMPAQNPGDPSGMSAYGRWMYGPWFWPPATGTKYGPISNPYYDAACKLDDPTTWTYQTDPFCEPEQIPGTPNVSAGMEQFNDTPIVNGVAYPTTTLQPKSYRLRFLNAANDRFFNLQWYTADPAQGNGKTEVALKPAELAAAQTDPNVVPTPVGSNNNAYGPDWIQIGNESGFLPTPAIVDGQQPTTWITDPTRFDVGNVDKHSMLLAPAERSDVVVDFSKFAGKTLILYNDAPAAFPARVPSYDYYTGGPDMSPNGAPKVMPGYGPNTRTVMQVKIAAAPVAPAFSVTKLQGAFKHHVDGSGVFESSQNPVVVGQSGYNNAYGTSFAASSNCNVAGSSVTTCDGMLRVSDGTVPVKDPVTGKDRFSWAFNTLGAPTSKMAIDVQPKAIHDEMNSSTFDEFGRMQANLGLEAQPPTPGAQNVTLYPYVNPPTELINGTSLESSGIKATAISRADDGTQIWRITHNGVDTHPVHFHLFDVQLLNRVTWDNIVMAPEPAELGWKDTVRVSPLEDTIVALRPLIPHTPFEVPNSVRNLNPMMKTGDTSMFNNVTPAGNPTATAITNQLVNFGWEYVFHCHILSHEEMDMMRPVDLAVPPIAPDGLQVAATADGTHLQVAFNDNSITETGFDLQRFNTDGKNTWDTVASVDSPLDQPNTHQARTVVDPTSDPLATDYQYRVVARNTVGLGGEFPSTTATSLSPELTMGTTPPPLTPTGLLATLAGAPGSPAVDLAWTDNATNETAYTVERAVSGTGVWQQLLPNAPATLPANSTTFSDTSVTQGTWDYRVSATNAGGTVSSATATIAVVPPSTPINLQAALVAGPAASLTWVDAATNETGYRVDRAPAGTTTWTALKSLVPGSTAYTDNTVAVGATYDYRVVAVNQVGESPSATVTVDVALPPAATGMSATLAAGPGVTVAWTDNATNETAYAVQRSGDNGATWTTVKSGLAPNATSYTDTAGLLVGGTYTYKVTVTNVVGSTDSAAVSIAVSLAAAPSGLRATLVPATVATGNASVNLVWTDNATTESGFVIQRSLDAGATWTTLTTLNGANPGVGAMATVDLAPIPGAVNTYRIGSVNVLGFAWSGSASVTLLPLPAAPANVAYTVGNGPSVRITWTDASTNEAGFSVQRSADNGATWTQLSAPGASAGTGTARTYRDTGVVNGRTYLYRVAARNSSGYVYSGTVPRVSITAPGVPVVAVPAQATTRSATGEDIPLSWAPVAGAADYRVQYARTSTGTGTVNVGTVTTTSITIVNIAKQVWYVRVGARNGLGTSWSAWTAVAAAP